VPRDANVAVTGVGNTDEALNAFPTWQIDANGQTRRKARSIIRVDIPYELQASQRFVEAAGAAAAASPYGCATFSIPLQDERNPRYEWRSEIPTTCRMETVGGRPAFLKVHCGGTLYMATVAIILSTHPPPHPRRFGQQVPEPRATLLTAAAEGGPRALQSVDVPLTMYRHVGTLLESGVRPDIEAFGQGETGAEVRQTAG